MKTISLMKLDRLFRMLGKATPEAANLVYDYGTPRGQRCKLIIPTDIKDNLLAGQFQRPYNHQSTIGQTKKAPIDFWSYIYLFTDTLATRW
jgi:hypothetical protein